MNESMTRNYRRKINAVNHLLIALTVIIVLNGGISLAQEDKLPDAATIVDRYVEVTGGKAAYERIHNSISKERIVHVGMDFEDKATTYKAMPNKQYTEIESEAMGKTRQGCDGQIVWYWSEQTGPMVEEGDALETNLISYAFDRIANWRKYYKKPELAGEETIDGKFCYKIIMTPNHGQPETCFFDMQSGLAIKYIKTRESSNMPPITMHIMLSDYKEVDGLLIPHKRHRSFDMCGSKREMVFVTDSIEHNVEIPSTRFDPPLEVHAVALKDKLLGGFKSTKSAPCNKNTNDSKKAPCKSGT